MNVDFKASLKVFWIVIVVILILQFPCECIDVWSDASTNSDQTRSTESITCFGLVRNDKIRVGGNLKAKVSMGLLPNIYCFWLKYASYVDDEDATLLQ